MTDKKKIIAIGTKLNLTNVDTFNWDSHFVELFPNLVEYDLIILNFNGFENIGNVEIGLTRKKYRECFDNLISKNFDSNVVVLGFDVISGLNPLRWEMLVQGGISFEKRVNDKNKIYVAESEFDEFVSKFYGNINVEVPNSKLYGKAFSPIISNSYQCMLAMKKKVLRTMFYFFPSFTAVDEKNEDNAIKWLLKKMGAWGESFEYLEQEKYLPKEVLEIRREKSEYIRAFEDSVRRYDERIEKAKENKKYLLDLLSSKEGQLHKSCQIVLQEILAIVNSNLKVIDVDELDEFKEKDPNKKHDLQMDLNNDRFLPLKYFLINVKSTDVKFRQNVINQMYTHITTFLKFKKCLLEEIHSIAILNNQPEANPENREELFGTNTKQVEENILVHEYTVFSSYTLYQLYNYIYENRTKITEEIVVSFLTKTGLIKFEDFTKLVESEINEQK